MQVFLYFFEGWKVKCISGFSVKTTVNMADKDDSEKTIAEDLVVTKYKMAAEITNSKFPV